MIRVKEESEEMTLNSTFKILGSWHPVPSLYGNIRGKSEAATDFIFLGSKITADSDCSNEI